jgi:hypothetical protein
LRLVLSDSSEEHEVIVHTAATSNKARSNNDFIIFSRLV